MTAAAGWNAAAQLVDVCIPSTTAASQFDMANHGLEGLFLTMADLVMLAHARYALHLPVLSSNACSHPCPLLASH
jgi:hypothetical protein